VPSKAFKGVMVWVITPCIRRVAVQTPSLKKLLNDNWQIKQQNGEKSGAKKLGMPH